MSNVKGVGNAPKVRRPFPIWIVWIVILIAVGIGGFFLFFWRAKLTVNVTPAEATLTINGESSKSGEVKSLAPGTYPIHVEAPGYLPFDTTVGLARNGRASMDLALKAAPAPIRLSEQHVQFLALDQSRSSLLYLEPSKKTVYRLRFDDPAKPVIDAITPDRLENIGEFIWSPDRGLAFYRQGGALKLYDFNRYDLVNQPITDWPSEVKNIDWRPDGAKVGYVYSDSKTGERTLIRATKNNEEVERIYNFGSTALQNPSLTWSPDAKHIAFVEKSLFAFDVFSKTLKELNVPGPIKRVRWSPNNTQLLFETDSGQLGLVGIDGEVSRLSLSGPLSRTAFRSDGLSLIHARGQGSSLKLVSVDLATLAESMIPLPATGDLTADNLLLGKDDSRLFFTSAGQPYLLDLATGQ